MKEGLGLQELATRVKEQSLAIMDFKAPTEQLRFNGELELQVNGHGTYRVSEWAHGQIAETFDIPAKFYNRLMEKHPDVLSQTVNALFEREPKVRMVRTLAPPVDVYSGNGSTNPAELSRGVVRAFVSDRYHRRDNIDLLNASLPALQLNNLDIRSMQVTDKKLYLKATSQLEGEVRKGDPIRLGVAISNSEIGAGATAIEPFIERLVCLNGAVLTEWTQRKAHLGRQLEGGGDVELLLSDEALAAGDVAFWLAFRDLMSGLLTAEFFDKVLTQARQAAERMLTNLSDVPRVVEMVAQGYGLQEAERTSVLDRLIAGNDFSQWGLANAITAASQTIVSYDRATDLEVIGGKVITLGPDEWRSLSESTPRKTRTARG